MAGIREDIAGNDNFILGQASLSGRSQPRVSPPTRRFIGWGSSGQLSRAAGHFAISHSVLFLALVESAYQGFHK